SSNVFSTAVTAEPAVRETATAAASHHRSNERMSDLRQDAAAVADLLDRDVVPVEQRQEQIGEARVLWIFQWLTALDPAVRVAQHGRRQRVVVVPVAVAHVAAEENRRM